MIESRKTAEGTEYTLGWPDRIVKGQRWHRVDRIVLIYLPRAALELWFWPGALGLCVAREEWERPYDWLEEVGSPFARAVLSRRTGARHAV